MQETISIFKEHNIRATHQRVQLYDLLAREEGHLTADQIYEKIHKKMPSLSLATIYATLEIFKKKGLVNEVRIDFSKSCFDARREGHHHFLCKKCKRIFDVDMMPCSALKNRKADGHLIEEFQGYFYGICKECQSK